MVKDCKVFETESDRLESPKWVDATAIFVVINGVVLATTSKPYTSSGGYLFNSWSLFGSS